MRFEELEQRRVMDGTSLGGFCTAAETPAPVSPAFVEAAVYGTHHAC